MLLLSGRNAAFFFSPPRRSKKHFFLDIKSSSDVLWKCEIGKKSEKCVYPCCQKRISTIHDSRVLESEGWTLFFFGSFFTKMMKIVKRNNSKKKTKPLTPVLLSVFMWLHDYIMWWMLKNEAVGTFPLLVFELAAGDGCARFYDISRRRENNPKYKGLTLIWPVRPVSSQTRFWGGEVSSAGRGTWTCLQLPPHLWGNEL